MNATSMQIDLYFFYSIKEGQEGRFQEYLDKVVPVTEVEEPYVLEYELFKSAEGIYFQHERYENEAAIGAHLQLTAEGQTAWGDAAELTTIHFVGPLSTEFREKYDFPGAQWYERFASAAR